MDALRATMGEIDSVPAENPARLRFDALHVWSTRLESGVILLGLLATLPDGKIAAVIRLLSSLLLS